MSPARTGTTARDRLAKLGLVLLWLVLIAAVLAIPSGIIGSALVAFGRDGVGPFRHMGWVHGKFEDAFAGPTMMFLAGLSATYQLSEVFLARPTKPQRDSMQRQLVTLPTQSTGPRGEGTMRAGEAESEPTPRMVDAADIGAGADELVGASAGALKSKAPVAVSGRPRAASTRVHSTTESGSTAAMAGTPSTEASDADLMHDRASQESYEPIGHEYVTASLPVIPPQWAPNPQGKPSGPRQPWGVQQRPQPLPRGGVAEAGPWDPRHRDEEA